MRGGEETSFGAADVARAVAAREALRALARANGTDAGPPRPAIAALNEALGEAGVSIRFTPVGPDFVPRPASPIDRVLAVIAGDAARAMIDGRWQRLKICPGADCGWAFYDRSRNRSGRWCSMTICGGRAKARAHYLRHREDA